MVDACLTNNGGCDYHTNCTSTNGTFVCGPCPEGLVGTGLTGCKRTSSTIRTKGKRLILIASVVRGWLLWFEYRRKLRNLLFGLQAVILWYAPTFIVFSNTYSSQRYLRRSRLQCYYRGRLYDLFRGLRSMQYVSSMNLNQILTSMTRNREVPGHYALLRTWIMPAQWGLHM